MGEEDEVQLSLSVEEVLKVSGALGIASIFSPPVPAVMPTPFLSSPYPPQEALWVEVQNMRAAITNLRTDMNQLTNTILTQQKQIDNLTREIAILQNAGKIDEENW